MQLREPARVDGYYTVTFAPFYSLANQWSELCQAAYGRLGGWMRADEIRIETGEQRRPSDFAAICSLVRHNAMVTYRISSVECWTSNQALLVPTTEWGAFLQQAIAVLGDVHADVVFQRQEFTYTLHAELGDAPAAEALRELVRTHPAGYIPTSVQFKSPEDVDVKIQHSVLFPTGRHLFLRGRVDEPPELPVADALTAGARRIFAAFFGLGVKPEKW